VVSLFHSQSLPINESTRYSVLLRVKRADFPKQPVGYFKEKCVFRAVRIEFANIDMEIQASN
jgi:hypothetical protein